METFSSGWRSLAQFLYIDLTLCASCQYYLLRALVSPPPREKESRH